MGKDSDYICTLDQATTKKAKDELNEIPEDRLSAVQAFREWIEAQPHIRCPKTDTFFLLRFLRWSKFSQVRAREKMEDYLNAKKRMPRVFLNLDPMESVIVELTKNGWGFPLPKSDAKGRVIIFGKLNADGGKALKKYGPLGFYRCMYTLMEYISTLEHSHVNGIVGVLDMSNFGPSSLKTLMTSEVSQAEVEFWKMFPVRITKLIMYKPGIIVDTLLAFFKPFVPKKVFNRISNFDTMDEVYKEIPMDCIPREYLPDDYDGPCVGTFDECFEQCLKAVTEKDVVAELKYRSSEAFGVDASKKPSEEVVQHFRKLNVD